jgi:hypothetical protein
MGTSTRFVRLFYLHRGKKVGYNEETWCRHKWNKSIFEAKTVRLTYPFSTSFLSPSPLPHILLPFSFSFSFSSYPSPFPSPSHSPSRVGKSTLTFHHHLTEGNRVHYQSIARFLSGNAVGLVLGGGACRGIAHSMDGEGEEVGEGEGGEEESGRRKICGKGRQK